MIEEDHVGGGKIVFKLEKGSEMKILLRTHIGPSTKYSTPPWPLIWLLDGSGV